MYSRRKRDEELRIVGRY
jgi:hypothetical protein